MGAAFGQARLGLFEGAIDLEVVFQFPLTPQARVEGLVAVLVAVPVALEQAAASLRQADSLVAVSRHSPRLDESVFT